jgi:sulfoxide reductase heme-binding subunit YedZ
MLRTGWEQLSRLLNAIANWKYFKPVVFIGCAVPLMLLMVKVWASELLPFGSPAWAPFVDSTIGGLGADPLKSLLHETGEDGLGVLLACLAITPIRRLFKVNGIQKVRRMVGVWAFVYAFIHVVIYLTLDQLCYSLETCEFNAIWQDVLKRKFIFMGLISFSILTVLAITSTTGWVRRLKKKWQTLHRLVYVAGIAGVIHFIWIQKADYSEPLMWAGWLAVFLLIRVYLSYEKRRARRTA